MDGGTRELSGKVYLIFGADVIANIHDADTLTPFLDHELFHVEHGRNFPECDKSGVRCGQQLATYAAQLMNPGADDRQLLLTVPKPIRAAVDATWPEAACLVRAKLDSSADNDISALFAGGAEASGFPERFGYYVGLRVAEESGGNSHHRSLRRCGLLEPGLRSRPGSTGSSRRREVVRSRLPHRGPPQGLRFVRHAP